MNAERGYEMISMIQAPSDDSKIRRFGDSTSTPTILMLRYLIHTMRHLHPHFYRHNTTHLLPLSLSPLMIMSDCLLRALDVALDPRPPSL